jgi:hypothetical protein
MDGHLGAAPHLIAHRRFSAHAGTGNGPKLLSRNGVSGNPGAVQSQRGNPWLSKLRPIYDAVKLTGTPGEFFGIAFKFEEGNDWPVLADSGSSSGRTSLPISCRSPSRRNFPAPGSGGSRTVVELGGVGRSSVAARLPAC